MGRLVAAIITLVETATTRREHACLHTERHERVHSLSRGDRECVFDVHFAVGLVADVHGVVLAVGDDAPGAKEPSPA